MLKEKTIPFYEEQKEDLELEDFGYAYSIAGLEDMIYKFKQYIKAFEKELLKRGVKVEE